MKYLFFIVFVSTMLVSCVTFNAHTKAVEHNDMDYVQKYLSENDIDSAVFRGMTLLMVAAEKGNVALINYLVEQGADVNVVREPGGRTALRYAIEQDYTVIVRYLLDNGADVLQKNESNWTALMTAAKYGNVEILTMLVEAGADIRVKTLKGLTALQIASDNKHFEAFFYLSKFYQDG